MTILAAPPRLLRVLHVINMGTTCGGAERLVADLATAQRAVGQDVRVLSSDLTGGGVRFSDATWTQPVRGRWWTRVAGQVSNPAARAALADELDRWQPDVVHLHTVGLVAPTTLRLLSGTPTVLTLHGPELFLRRSEVWCMPPRYFRTGTVQPRLTLRGRLTLAVLSRLIGPLWRNRLGVVDVFVAPSRYLADLAARDFTPIRVVPNGLATAPVVPRPRQGGSGPPRVLFAGRLEHFKGPQVLLDAVPAIQAEHPDVRVTICGAGPMLEALRDRADRLGVAHAVEFTGWLPPDGVTRRIAGAEVVVIPSVWPEAFGLTCLEASAASRPVVASAVGALPDVVDPDVTGLLVPPGEPPALATAINRLLSDEPLRQRMGAAGRERAARYHIEAHRQAVEEAYVEAAQRPQPAGGGYRQRLRTDSLLRNTVMLLLATVVLAGGGFLFWQLVAHLFTPAEVGRASALISVSTLVANLAMLGMNNSLIRYLREWPDRARTVNSCVLPVAAAAALGALGFAAVAPVVAPRVVEGLDAARLAGFGLLTVAGALGMLYDNVFIALRRSGQILGRNTLVVVLRLILPAMMVGFGGYGVFTAYWAAFGLALVPYLLALRRTLPLRARISARRLREMWRYSVGTYTATIILMLPTLLMPAVVAQRVGAGPAGFYYVAALVASILLFVPQATGRSLFAEATHDPGRLRTDLVRVLRMTAAIQLPLTAALIALGWPLLRLFGPDYARAYPLLILLIVTNALSSVGYVGSTLLLISGRTRLLCLLSAVAYAVSVVGGYLLAPAGLVWIGGALLAGEALLAAGYLVLIRRALRGEAAA